jgi:hypothetical protein
MDIRDKAMLLVQFTQDNFNDDVFTEFFDYNDLGIPMAIAVVQDMVVLTDSGLDLLEETWKELCTMFNVDPEKEYESIDDLMLLEELE